MKSIFLITALSLLTTQTNQAERTLTHTRQGHLIHNSQIFSHDGDHIIFDFRTDETQLIASTGIGMVNVHTGKETTLYRVAHPNSGGPGVGAPSFSPCRDEAIFIHGLDSANEARPYAAQRRSAAYLSLTTPGKIRRLDARDVSAPFTLGALRGGTHAHHWSGDGSMVSFTYNDAVVPAPGPAPADLRSIGVTVCHKPVTVAAPEDAENFSGLGFSVILAPVTANPKPGSDEISRAYEEGWVGTNGYLKPDGSRQAKAIAFLGNVVTTHGTSHSEVFIVDLPDDLSTPGPTGPLEGSATALPAPPAGVVMRRLTHTEASPQPGLQGPRHWIRPSPDGSIIAFLDEDENGITQVFGVSPMGGKLRQISKLSASVDCPFSWSPCGNWIACSAGAQLQLIDCSSGKSQILTRKFPDGQQPRHGTVFSPHGRTIAFNRLLPHPDGGDWLQVCIVDLPASTPNH
jgi:hypothetical protein